MTTRELVLVAYGLANAVLYSSLLPLWEGFDEPFHFGYVQNLANGYGLPDARTARLSREVAASILLAPASHVVKQNLPQVTSYSEYFSWPVERRRQVQQRLWAIPPALRWHTSEFLNYEAHHPPLAYLILSVPERLLEGASLPKRVLALRIIAAVASALLLHAGAARLFSELRVADPYRSLAMFCLLSSQMTWATLAHVANDWLAVPTSIWALVALIRYGNLPNPRNAALMAVFLSLGLLTKAYFLAVVPLGLALSVFRRRWRELGLTIVLISTLAGPWYARNFILYGELTNMQESRGGLDVAAMLDGATRLKWMSMIPSSAREALWTGNNTLRTFSANTLNLMLWLSLAALFLWLAARHEAAELIVLAYCLLYILALAYVSVLTYLYTPGGRAGPSPWYTQVLFAPMLALMFLGAMRWRRIGGVVGLGIGLLFGYVLAATYAAKLIPLYAGDEGRMPLVKFVQLYAYDASRLTTNLDCTALAPARGIFIVAGIVISMIVVQQIMFVRCIVQAKLRAK